MSQAEPALTPHLCVLLAGLQHRGGTEMHKKADGQSDLNHDQSDGQVGARSAGRDQQAGERHVLGASARERTPLGVLCRVPGQGNPSPMLWTDTSSGRKQTAPDSVPFFLPLSR